MSFLASHPEVIMALLPVSTARVMPSSSATLTGGSRSLSSLSQEPVLATHLSAPLWPKMIISFRPLMIRTMPVPSSLAIRMQRFSPAMCLWYASSSTSVLMMGRPTKLWRVMHGTWTWYRATRSLIF